MSLILMLFYWVVIPYTVFWLARRSWRNSESTLSKGLVIGITSIIFVGLLWLAAGERWWLDSQVRKLCAEDGGIKVFETVMLSPEKFNIYEQINFYRPVDGESSLGEEYVFKRNKKWFKNKGSISSGATMLRQYYAVVRKQDRKVLGETVIYGRGGGDLPGPWQPSTFNCPALPKAGPNALLRAIFINSNMEGE